MSRVSKLRSTPCVRDFHAHRAGQPQSLAQQRAGGSCVRHLWPASHLAQLYAILQTTSVILLPESHAMTKASPALRDQCRLCAAAKRTDMMAASWRCDAALPLGQTDMMRRSAAAIVRLGGRTRSVLEWGLVTDLHRKKNSYFTVVCMVTQLAAL
eukprot:2982162-Pleurochrysis_carterae.AAC.3